jgi:hypothetical protein
VDKIRRFDHNNRPNETGEDSVAFRKVVASRRRAWGVFGDERAGGRQLLGQLSVLGRVDTIWAGTPYRPTPPTRKQGAAVRRFVHSTRHARNHDHSGAPKFLAEQASNLEAVWRRLA